MHIVCQVVFAWKKLCLEAALVMFLPKTRNNRMTGRFSSINPACCIVALSAYRSEQGWYVCVHVYTYGYSRNWLGTRSWRHIVASYIENHSRVGCTGSVYIHRYTYVERRTRARWMLAANRHGKIANKLRSPFSFLIEI